MLLVLFFFVNISNRSFRTYYFAKISFLASTINSKFQVAMIVRCEPFMVNILYGKYHLLSFFPYAYVSTKLIDRILLTSVEPKTMSLISPVKILCLSLLNLCCEFNINLFLVMKFLWFSKRVFTWILFFSG